MNIQLPTPNAADAKQLHSFRALPGVRTSLVKIKHSVQRIAEISDGTVLALAKQQFPDLPSPGAALAALAERLEEVADAVLTHSHAFETEWAEEKRRAAPLVMAATHRMFTCFESAERLNRKVARADSDVQERRERLTKAGCTAEDAAKLVPDIDITALEGEREGLLSEAHQLEKFIKSKDESDLPGDFREKWVYPEDMMDTVAEVIRVDKARAAQEQAA
jgi:hypothetical protein